MDKPIPKVELERLEELRLYQMLVSMSVMIDFITAMAAKICVKFQLISLVTKDKIMVSSVMDLIPKKQIGFLLLHML
jgi:hypothetical protein